MKTWLALVALCALLLAATPVLGEIGDAPRNPADYLAADRVAQLEHKRQADAVGGVTGSPYWLWQGYLCGRSVSLRLYEVKAPMIPTQMLFKERIRYAEDGSGDKELLLTAIKATEDIELRIGSDALEMMERTGITRIIVRNSELKTVDVYERKEITAACRYFSLGDAETLCLQGEDGPLYAYDEDSERRALSN